MLQETPLKLMEEISDIIDVPDLLKRLTSTRLYTLSGVINRKLVEQPATKYGACAQGGP